MEVKKLTVRFTGKDIETLKNLKSIAKKNNISLNKMIINLFNSLMNFSTLCNSVQPIEELQNEQESNILTDDELDKILGVEGDNDDDEE